MFAIPKLDITFNMLIDQELLSHGSRLLGVVALLGCLQIVAVCIYRLKFHPLSRYPGPWLAKVSDVYSAYQSWKGRSHLKHYEAHQRYGPFVRWGPNKLVINSAIAVQDIYASKRVRKSPYYHGIVVHDGAHSLHTSIEKEMHRRKRKLISVAFSEQAIRNFETGILDDKLNIFLSEIFRTRKAVDGKWTEPIDMTPRFIWLALDVVGEFAFGRSFDLQISSTNRFIPYAISKAAIAAGIGFQLPSIKHVTNKFLSTGKWTREKFLGVLLSLVQERLKMTKDAKPDMFSLIIDAKDPETGEGISLQELWAEARLFTVAGSDTTATALCAVFFYLSRYPECYKKLSSIIRETFTSAYEIRSGPKLNQCRYLKCCIDEALRICPPLGLALWREVIEDDTLIDGEYVPKGVNVGTSVYAIHHDEDLFPEPFVYRPERWLEEADTELAKKRRFAFNPFSVGPRQCVARNMAYAELQLTVARTLWYFDMRVPDGPERFIGEGFADAEWGRQRVDEYQVEEHFDSGKHDGPCLQFRCREGFEEELARSQYLNKEIRPV